ncbi:MAG: hypothetical protein HY286_13775 [Planctomycetes bacterium]|nr:hypothetical protein [Planctomycetota bacterium]
MRILSTIATVACLAPFAAAQTPPSPNAIGLWRSDDPGKGLIFNLPTGIAAGQTGTSIWSVLPPDVLTYFRTWSTGHKRELDFRGVGVFAFIPTITAAKAFTLPKIELRKAVQAPSPNQDRYLPSLTPAGLLVTFPAVNLGTFNAPAGVVFPFDQILTTPTSVALSTGQGLAIRVVDYCSQYGVNNSLEVMISSTETLSSTMSNCFSGITQGAPQVSNWIDKLYPNLTNHEFMFTYYFDQSIIAPLKNAKQLAGGSLIPGGNGTNTLPTSLDPANGGFAVSVDDGRGALYPVPGDVVSWSTASNLGVKLGPTQIGQVWLIPFILFEGDIIPSDPAPEDWVGANGVPELAYIHPMPLQKYLDDIDFLSGNVTPYLGGAWNPNNSTLGLYLGVDYDIPGGFPNSYLNGNAFGNAFNYASIANGPAFAGPELAMYDKKTNPTGNICKNPIYWNTTYTGELKTLIDPQHGFTPVVGAASPPFVGIDYPLNLPVSVAGLSFYVTCWQLDIASPINVFGVNILDMSTVLKITLH